MDESTDTRTLYCGNLAEEVTEELLYELCLQAGPIEKISIPTNNGRRRNYGFVTYKHAVSVPYATKLLSEETLFKKKIVFRARGHSNDSPRNSPKADERRNSSPDVSVIHDKRRMSHHTPLNQSSPYTINNYGNQGNYSGNRQINPNLSRSCTQYSPIINISQYPQLQNYSHISGNIMSPPVFSQNRFSYWK